MPVEHQGVGQSRIPKLRFWSSLIARSTNPDPSSDCRRESSDGISVRQGWHHDAHTIVAVAIDDRTDLQKMVDRIARENDGRRPEYTFLSDPGHRVIDRYGLLNPSGRGWPHPTTYVIDREGVVRWKFTEVNYKIRPTNDMILEALTRIR